MTKREMLRRAAVLGAGIAAVTIEIISSRTSRAGGRTGTESECLNVGGEPIRHESEKYFFCNTPARDKECAATRPVQYTPDGKRKSWIYDINRRSCVEHLKGRGQDCFLTTACVEHIGLADNCFELEALRQFRDTRLALMPGGREDIELYYRVAPAIVAHIETSGDAARELARLYTRYVLPSAIAVRCGFDQLGRNIYTRMMRDLAARYQIPLSKLTTNGTSR